jgi:hypothetical protein
MNMIPFIFFMMIVLEFSQYKITPEVVANQILILSYYTQNCVYRL